MNLELFLQQFNKTLMEMETLYAQLKAYSDMRKDNLSQVIKTDNLIVFNQKYPSLTKFNEVESKVENKIESANSQKEQNKVKINGITIFKNKTCSTWYTRYRKDGKQYYISGKTQKEVADKLRDSLNIVKKEKQIGITLNKWFNDWLQLYKINKVKENTIKDYKLSIKHINEIILNKNIKQIKIDDIVKVLNNIEKERAKQKVYELLSQIFEKAKNHKIIKENIFDLIEKPKHKKEKGIALSKEEQEMLLQIIKENKYKEIYKIVLYQGLRIGEALAITGNDINIENKTISINKSMQENGTISTTKNEQSNRIIPLFNPTIEILKQYKNYGEEYIFKTPYKTLAKNFRTLVDNSNLPKISLHDLRHTFITNCQNENIPEHIIQSWVGHEIGSKVTKQVYTHTTKDANLLNINKLNASKFYSNSTHK